MLQRTALRTQRAAAQPHRAPLRVRRNVRFQSQSSKVTPDSPGASGAITGGLAGGAASLIIVYAWYSFSGTKGAVQAAKQTKSYVDSAVNSLKVQWEDKTPDTDTALKTLRDGANKYATFIPGAKQYVDSAFDDLETIRKFAGSVLPHP